MLFPRLNYGANGEEKCVYAYVRVSVRGCMRAVVSVCHKNNRLLELPK